MVQKDDIRANVKEVLKFKISSHRMPFFGVFEIMGLDLRIAYICLAVRFYLRDLLASIRTQSENLSANSSSLLGRTDVLKAGSKMSLLRYFLIVLRDNAVRRLISRIGIP
jgi:hypothetical protein